MPPGIFRQEIRHQPTAMQIIRQRGYARAGLIGNPSDGYFGKTISVVIRDFYATTVLYEWENFELRLSQDDRSVFDSIDDLVTDVQQHGYYGGIRLVKATIKKFVEFCQAQQARGDKQYRLHDRKFAVRYESNIPRQVGLAGSSAIIVATLRALMDFYSIEIPMQLQPSLVLSIETDELGISAGLQDRVIQIYEGLVFMDFARENMCEIEGHQCGQYEPLDPKLLPPIYIAYSTDVGEPTEVLHKPLRARYEAKDPEVLAAFKYLAELTVEAREAIDQSDGERLGDLMNANFACRQSICSLHKQHVQMIEAAQDIGASAKYAGSGGAIVGTYRDQTMFDKLCDRLASLPGISCQVFRPTIMSS